MVGLVRGLVGVRCRSMLAAWGVRLPLRELQGTHAVTRFSQVSRPPSERGMTWSTVSSRLGNRLPQ